MRDQRRWLRRLLAAGALLVAAPAVLYVLVVAAFGAPPVWHDTAAACAQPGAVTYDDEATYAVYVRKPTVALSLARPPSTAVVSSSGGGYGVAIELHQATGADDLDCTWNRHGVEIREPNGVAHVVPASVFTGGR